MKPYLCHKCGDEYLLRDGHTPTVFCDPCAQTIISGLRKIVPRPPNAITWENGTQILNTIQRELYNLPHQEITY